MRNNTRNYVLVLAAFVILLAGSTKAFSQAAPAANTKEQISHLQKLIKQAGGKWVAGETSLSNLPMQDWKMLVGLNFKVLNAPSRPKLDNVSLPTSLDWRNSNGNFVTGVRNQAKCGSCWAFSMTAGLESYILITRNMPGTDLDLSEQVMLSCSGTGSCNGGYLDAEYISDTGLPLETVYPYTATDGSCASAAPGWQDSAYKADTWMAVTKDLTSMKAALVKYGPLPTAFMVYEDFMHYKSGIYSYTTGKKLGGHAVLLVGYNDEEQYFLVKNSWGTGWGEEGFFKIAYTEMKMPVNFGLSTIAYDKYSPYKPLPLTGSLPSEETWRVSPLFAPLLQLMQ